jgi:nucleoid DNA-binding protein
MSARRLDIAKVVATETGMTIQESRKLLGVIISAMADLIVKDGRLEIRGLGTFRVLNKRCRRGTNPKTGAIIKIPAKPAVVFKQGTIIRNRVQWCGSEVRDEK